MDINNLNWEEYPRIPYLPQTRSITGLEEVTVAHFTEPDLDDIFALVCGAAERGEDIGVDEYPSLQDWMKGLEEAKPAAGLITVRESGSKSLKAVIRFHCSRFARSMTPCTAEMKLVMAEGVRKNLDSFCELVQLGEQLVKDCGAFYSGTTMETFIHNHDSIKALRSARFHITCMIPALVKAPKIGVTEAVVFYKDFGTTLPKVEDISEKKEDEDEGSVESILADAEFPQMPFLPVERPLLTSRVQAIIRNPTKDDVVVCYELLKGAAARGVGYAVDEFPDMPMFIKYTMLHYYTGMIEEKETGRIIGFVQFQKTMFQRTPDTPVADCHVAINPKIAGKGMGMDIGDIVMRCSAQMGFKYMLSDTLVIHTPVINITRKMNYKIIGTVPNVSYVKNRGWEDCLYMLHDVGNYYKMLDDEAIQLKGSQTNGSQTNGSQTNGSALAAKGQPLSSVPWPK